MILFATDFSELSLAALPVAESLVGRDKLVIVHVMPHIVESRDYPEVLPYPDRYRIREHLKSIIPSNSKIRYEHRLLHGNPASQILDLATELNVKLIVVGTHGRSGVERVLMGSVAESVMRGANCGVVTVRSQSHVLSEQMS